MGRRGFIVLLLACVGSGCYVRNAAVTRLRTDDPRVQAATIAQVVRAGDRSTAGELIDLLESEDEGVRFMAALALHKLTGIDRGFHFAKPDQRPQIIAEWRQWWKAEGAPAAGVAQEADTVAPEENGS